MAAGSKSYPFTYESVTEGLGDLRDEQVAA